jgi:hypothetical protein
MASKPFATGSNVSNSTAAARINETLGRIIPIYDEQSTNKTGSESAPDVSLCTRAG